MTADILEPTAIFTPFSGRFGVGPKLVQVEPFKKTANITERDIKLGCPKHSMKCPLARAVKRLFPDALAVSVGTCTVAVFGPQDEEYHASIPSWMTTWIADYDSEEFDLRPVKVPLEFTGLRLA